MISSASGSCLTSTMPMRRLGARPAAEVQDHPLVRGISRAASALRGAPRRFPAGGYWAMPKLFDARACWSAIAGGLMNLASLKGVHYAIKSACSPPSNLRGAAERRKRSFEYYEEAVEESIIGKDMWETAATRSAVPDGPHQGWTDRESDDRHERSLSRRALVAAPQRMSSRCSSARPGQLPKPDGSTPSTSFFGVHHSQRHRDDARPIRVRNTFPASSPKRGAGCVRRACTRFPRTRRRRARWT